MPVGGVVVVGRMIHHGDGGRLSGRIRTLVTNPAGPLAPGFLVGLLFRIQDVPLGYFAFMAHGRADPDGKRPFFGVAKGDLRGCG